MIEKRKGSPHQTMRSRLSAVATHLLQVVERGLIISALLEVVLCRFDDPVDDLGIDAALLVVI